MINMTRHGASNWIIGMVVVLIILIIAQAMWQRKDRFTLDWTQEVHSGVDGLFYRVHGVHKNPDKAADTMAKLNRRAIDLMRHLRKKYLRGPAREMFPARAKATQRLLNLYNPDNLAENSPRDPEGDTSYTIDKGAILALCLREKNPARNGDPAAHDIHDLDTLTFVTFHELTHIAIEDLDHPPRFWQAFKFILEEALHAGLISGVDYRLHPTVYCGMDIDYNPLYDKSLTPIT